MSCGCSGSAPEKSCGCGHATKSVSVNRSTVGIPGPTRSGGVRFETDPSDRRVFEALAPGLDVSTRVAISRPLPIGVRPSVPERAPFEVLFRPDNLSPVASILFDAFRGAPDSMVEMVMTLLRTLPADTLAAAHDYLMTFPDVPSRLAALSGVAAANGQIPAGPAPSSVPPNREAVPPSQGYAISTTAAAQLAMRRVPPPPVPQKVCLTNGFDDRWGAPPSTYKDIALQFDPSVGAYRFDFGYAVTASPGSREGRPLYDRFVFDGIKRTFDAGLLLFPFRRNLASPWEYRWDYPPRPPIIVCSTP